MKDRFVKLSAVILFAFGAATAGAAQDACELKSKTAPLLLNLQLEMSPEQARSIFGKDLKIKIKKNGERTFFQNFIKNPAPNSLNKVRALYLRFFDRKLYQFEIFYEPRADLKTLDETVNALSSQLNFRASDWQIENRRAALKCAENSIVIDNVLNPRIELTNEIVRAKVVEKRLKK